MFVSGCSVFAAVLCDSCFENCRGIAGPEGGRLNKKPDNRFVTLFALTNDGSKSRQWKATIKQLKIGGGIAIALLLILAFVVIDYSRLKYNTSELYSLRKENTAQRIELQEIAAKIREMESRVASLNVFDRKLRIIANIENSKTINSAKGDQMIGGVGGGISPDDEGFLLTTRAKTTELVSRMSDDLKQLETSANRQESSFTELAGELQKKSSYLASMPSIWPVRGWLTSGFGERTSPFTGFTQVHQGIDIANRIGTPIIAPSNGIVVQAGREEGLGKNVIISHGYGIKTIYGHMSELYVKAGQRISRGDKIGAVGNTGHSTGSHLHYQVSIDGVNVNPSKYILN